MLGPCLGVAGALLSVVADEPPLTAGAVISRILVVLALVLACAFFVAAEFALVATRRSRIEHRSGAGDGTAKLIERTLKDIDRYISTTQVGITVSILALGWLGEDAIATLVDAGLRRLDIVAPAAAVHTTAGAIVGFIIVTLLLLVFGQLMPKTLVLVRPERASTWIVRPLVAFAAVTQPFIALVNGMANGLLRLFGVKSARALDRVHSPEELRLLVMQSRAQGALDESDSAMLAGVFDFHEKRARDVMRPRTDIVAVDVDSNEDDVWQLMRTERYSRYPVYEHTLDDVIGVLVAKDLWLADPSKAFDLRSFVRKPLYVPDTRPAVRVLDDLRRSRAHMAVVLDEYGGTAGIVTLEDLVEEVIGDINDEYDFAIREAIEANGVLELAGSMSLVDVRSDYRLPIPDGDWTTLGGYTFARLGRVPRIGDRASFPGGELEVVAMDGRRVAALRVVRQENGVRRYPRTANGVHPNNGASSPAPPPSST